ncbi:MAG: TetR/AcrR family transcriptional regulator [Solirubrobacterales bacterium]|nr:TetR/AcrR family transcriptional regulator [Solirubrobacterales bacterium]
MAPPIQTTRESWLAAGLQALAAGGPDGVRVESVAKSLGVSKGGFYGLFAGRDEFLTALLDEWERSLVDRVITEVEAGGGDARARLAHLYTLADTHRDLLDVELSIREWARHSADVAARLKRVDERRLVYMRPLFSELCSDRDEVEARCLTALALFVAAPLISAPHGALRAAAARLVA